jgi:inorganic pyrophosphatase
MTEVRRFFEDYKVLEHKKVVVERFLDRTDAIKILEASIVLYNEKKGELRGVQRNLGKC